MQDRSLATAAPSRWALVIALGTVYFIWGSTYLAIRIAIETIPPFLMLGTRFVLAGAVLYGWMRWRGVPAPSVKQWRTAALIGGLMLCAGTGTVGWAEQYIPSGLAALLITTVPLWMVLLDWLWQRGQRPNAVVFFGLLLGLAGVGVLVDPLAVLATYTVDVFVASMVLLGALAWSVGSLYGRRVDLPTNPFMSTALQMVAGGALLTLTGLLLGESAAFDVTAFSLRSFASWSYLVFFGAILAFSAYVWLLRNTSPAQATTYAYVNPVVAVFLGWALMDEPLNARILLAVGLLITAVVLINRYGQPARSKTPSGAASLRPIRPGRAIRSRRTRTSRPVLPRPD